MAIWWCWNFYWWRFAELSSRFLGACFLHGAILKIELSSVYQEVKYLYLIRHNFRFHTIKKNCDFYNQNTYYLTLNRDIIQLAFCQMQLTKAKILLDCGNMNRQPLGRSSRGGLQYDFRESRGDSFLLSVLCFNFLPRKFIIPACKTAIKS